MFLKGIKRYTKPNNNWSFSLGNLDLTEVKKHVPGVGDLWRSPHLRFHSEEKAPQYLL